MQIGRCDLNLHGVQRLLQDGDLCLQLAQLSQKDIIIIGLSADLPPSWWHLAEPPLLQSSSELYVGQTMNMNGMDRTTKP